MKTLFSILVIVLAFSLNAQAVTFEKNLFEIHEVNILEEELNSGILN